MGAAIMLQSLIGTIGTLMGCFGNKRVYGVFVVQYWAYNLPFGQRGVQHTEYLALIRLAAVSSLTDCWYWLLLLLR